MTMAEMVERMKELGSPQAAIDFMLSSMGYSERDMSRSVTRDMRDAKRDRVRDMARERQRRKREKDRLIKANAEANDAASERDKQRDSERDGRLSHCNSSLPFLGSKEANQEEGSSKRGVTRARGTRITRDWQPDEASRKFALDHGANPDPLRDEFIDYWIAVPGQRGTKLDWQATYRNRVRQVSASKGYRNGQTENPLTTAIRKAREFARSGDSDGPGVPKGGPEGRG